MNYQTSLISHIAFTGLQIFSNSFVKLL
uniref:Uncharacterized protein n=1 Tax=Anguilla anguilla TaxID=7936 RepID=A0A0E9QRH1_ANGAN